MKPEFFYRKRGRLSHTVAYFGGAPTVQPINIGKEISGALEQFPRITSEYRGLVSGEPLLTGATGLAQNMMTSLPGLMSPIQSALGKWISPVLRTGGALTPAQRTQAINDFRAAGAGSGMNRTNPGIFATGMDVFNLEQSRFNQALNQEIGATGALQGLETTAINAPLAVEQGGVNAFAELFGFPSGAASQAAIANQQAQATNATAAANKQAGTTSGILSSLGTAAGVAIGV